ncbi:MAG TPA: nucleotidyltransferase family protein [Candidatus Nitrosotalea sp.]|nr:nucleotidyltransferase family protein [Candidatus Nitrosotalea sp.]
MMNLPSPLVPNRTIQRIRDDSIAYTKVGSPTEKSLPLSDQPDLTSFRDEWPVLLECASPAFDTQRLAELARSVDWSRLLNLAEEHGVVGHLAARLPGLDEAVLPAEIRQAVVERHRTQLFSTLRIVAELFYLLKLFETRGIPVLVVKGPVLAIQAYGDPGIRNYGDLDFLVRQHDIRAATESLQAAGFQAAVPLSAIDAGKIPGQYLFKKTDTKLIVELHNDLTLRYFPRRLPLEGLFDRRILVRLDTQEVPTLALEDVLVYICVHGATHLWDRLSWIADVAAFVVRQTDIDWQASLVRAKEVGAERMLYMGLRLASDMLHMRVPGRITAAVEADKGAAELASRVRFWLTSGTSVSPTLFERAAFRLRMRGSRLAAPAYLLRLTLSPTEEDWGQGGPQAEHSVLDALRRPFRLARKYGRREKS